MATQKVSLDSLVAFEGRHYSVPFVFAGLDVEVHGCAEAVHVLLEAQIIAVHARHTPERLVIDPRHYEGRSTDRVQAPVPLGRLGRRMLERAGEPVARRSIDYYAALADVTR